MRIALAQMTSGIDPAANARMLRDAAAEAARQGAAILFTPEMTGLLDRNRKRAAEAIADEANDATLAAARQAAAEHGIWIALGSLAIADGPVDAKWSNRAFLIDGSGEVVARYDKIHLFDVTLATGESWRESDQFRPGEKAVVATGPDGARIGLSVCYDLRFPALYEKLSEAGAQILSIPAAFTATTGAAHWHSLQRARAIEAGCFVVAAAQTGAHQDGRQTYGHSLVYDPWGELLLDMGDAPGVAVCDIDLARIEEVRAQVPSLANRRAISHVEVCP